MNKAADVPDVWILGASGRIGRAVATRLAARGIAPTLVGRNIETLQRIAQTLGVAGGVACIACASASEMAGLIESRRPAIVFNALGRYAETAIPIARACLYGAHYVDLAVDLRTMQDLFGLHAQALAGHSTIVTGAGFGVLATEAVVVKLCEGRPTAAAVRVDALASVATEAGTTGDAFAATVLDVLTTGGRRIRNGRLVKNRLGSDAGTITTPDGSTLKSAGVPIGELLAAQRASGASDVVATSAMAPTGVLVRSFLPLVGAVMSIPAVGRFAARQMARAKLTAAPRPRPYSWGHAIVTWPDGQHAEGWLRVGDGMDYTADVSATVIAALLVGRGKPGVFTPAMAFGHEIAVEAGGTFLP